MRDLVLLVVAAATIGSVRGQAAEGAEEAHAMEEEHHRSLSVAAMALCAAFVAAACISNVLERFAIQSVIPPSSVMIAMGMVLGVLGTFDPAMQGDEAQPEKEYPGYMQFDVEMFQFFLLPIIIFSSAYNLPDGAMRVFFVQIGRIVFFAVFGTIVAISFTGFLLLTLDRAIGFMDAPIDTNTIFMFASLISAVDPVATLGAFGALGVHPKL